MNKDNGVKHSKYDLDQINEIEDPIAILDYLLETARFIAQKISRGNPQKYFVDYDFDFAKTNLESYDPFFIWTKQNFACYLKLNADKNKVGELYKKVIFRHLRSFDKFIQLVDVCLTKIFDEEQLRTLFENHVDYFSQSDFLSVKEKIKKLFYMPNGSFKDSNIMIEGFIMEGKTEFLNSKQILDSEISDFYRMKLKNGMDLPNKYFKIFALVGIYFTFHQYLMEDRKEFIIDRSWISHWYFYTKNSDDFDFILDEKFYCAIFSWIPFFVNGKHLIEKEQDTMKFEFSIIHKTIVEKIPWPFYEKREMESKIYFDKASLAHCYREFYHMLFKHLSAIKQQ